MTRFAKMLTGAAAAAVVTVSAAAPAQAQYYGRNYHRYDRGIDAGDIITGVAVLGGIAAIASALGRDGGYGYGNRYRGGYSAAVNACGYEAERYGRGGRVSVTDVDRRGSYSYRVRGVIDSGGGYGYDRGGYGYGYDRGGYGYNRGYDNYGRSSFTCTARSDGRVTNFRTNDGYRY